MSPRPKPGLRFAAVLATCWFNSAPPALAQVALPQGPPLTERHTAVRDRVHPELESPAIVWGSINLRPSLGVAAIYDDNVFATALDERADMAIRVTPQLAVQSNWGGTDRVTLRAAAQADRFLTRTTENRMDLDFGADSIATIDRGTKLSVALRWQNQREPRLSQDVFARTEEPVRFSLFGLGAGVSRSVGSLTLAGDGSIVRSDYFDARSTTGAEIDEDFRDNDLYRVRGRVSFSQSPALGWFGQVTYEARDFRRAEPGGTQRDAKGLELLAGVAFEPKALVRGELGVGYLNRRYRDPVFEDFSGFAVNGKLEFFPSQLTTVTLTAKREAVDTGIPQSTGYISTGGQAVIDHELLRSLILSASVSYYVDKFNGIDRSNRRRAARALVDYRMDRNVGLRLSYEYLDLSSSGSDRYRSYEVNRLLLGVTVRL